MDLAIVILNYRTPGLVADCLASIEPERDSGADFQVVVVDNCSGDDSADRIAETIRSRGWEGWARLVVSPGNDGFSAGNNVGMRSIDAPAYLLLNSDTLVRPGAIRRLVQELRDHPEAGLIGPRLEWPDGTGQNSAFRFPTPLSDMLRASALRALEVIFLSHVVPVPVPKGPVECGWLSFAAVVIRREVLDKIGPMDEGYFMYFEDIDFARRAARAGWKRRYCPEARVVHLRGGSSPVKSLTEERKRRPEYFYAARARYYAKFYGRMGLWLSNVLWGVGWAISVVRGAISKRPNPACEKQWSDQWRHAMNPMRPFRPKPRPVAGPAPAPAAGPSQEAAA